MHTDRSLAEFRQASDTLCAKLRQFANDVCPKYHTTELAKEVDARTRRTKKAADTAVHQPISKKRKRTEPEAPTQGKKRKVYSLTTPKHHFVPDAPAHVSRMGSLDSASTQLVS